MFVCIQVFLAIHVTPGEAAYNAPCTDNANCEDTGEECINSKCACTIQHYNTGTECAASNI